MCCDQNYLNKIQSKCEIRCARTTCRNAKNLDEWERIGWKGAGQGGQGHQAAPAYQLQPLLRTIYTCLTCISTNQHSQSWKGHSQASNIVSENVLPDEFIWFWYSCCCPKNCDILQLLTKSLYQVCFYCQLFPHSMFPPCLNDFSKFVLLFIGKGPATKSDDIFGKIRNGLWPLPLIFGKLCCIFL